MPDDILIGSGDAKLYIPVMTSELVSFVLGLILCTINRWIRAISPFSPALLPPILRHPMGMESPDNRLRGRSPSGLMTPAA